MSLSALALTLTLAAPAQVDAAAQTTYAGLLKAWVKDGRVDYAGLAKKDLPKLDAYLDAVAKASLPKERDARMAFYIDAYNALVIKSVIAHERPRSVLDVKGFFNADSFTVAGQKVTLDALEKQHLNPFAKDPRTHFVLVCGAVGCPILEGVPYTGSNLNARLDAATRRYLTSPTGARVQAGAVELSKIFDWYAGDFGGAAGVLTFVRKHLPEAQAQALGDSPRVGYIDYNWTLNQQ
jgi:hypothetical protein